MRRSCGLAFLALAPCAAVALVGSLLASYSRARAQSLGVDSPDGIGGRDARILILVVFALFGLIYAALLLVAVTGAITFGHRTISAARTLRRMDREQADRDGGARSRRMS